MHKVLKEAAPAPACNSVVVISLTFLDFRSLGAPASVVHSFDNNIPTVT